jgi:transcriptional regulator with XRE-family HTH domain
MTLKRLLAVHKLTAAQLARQARIDPSHISHVLSGRQRVSPNLAFKIATVTGTQAVLVKRAQYDFRPIETPCGAAGGGK